MKFHLIFLCVLVKLNLVYGRAVDSVNPRISSRFQYVTCRFENVDAFDDEYLHFGTHLKSEDDGKVYKIFIGAKFLYSFLYPDRGVPSRELLYVSVGKMLIYDTITLKNNQIASLLKFHLVNEKKLNQYIKMGFYKNYKSLIDYSNRYVDCMDNEWGYYFDRLFYPAGSYHVSTTSICVVDFDYSCAKNLSPVPFYDKKNNSYKAYYYNDRGQLIKEEDIR